MDKDTRHLEEFEAARPILTGLAYRILGSLAEAEDVVQDTFLSWMSIDEAEIRQPKSWLTTVCTRKAVDALRSARRARTSYFGVWLPEPIHTHVLETPEDQSALADSVTMAFLLVLERLAPKERAAFLLHDVFSTSYQDIAASLDVSEPACRKLVSRARANVRREDNGRAVPLERQDELVAEFKLAIETGSTERLSDLLSADVTLSADSGGKVIAVEKTLEGAAEVLPFVGQILSPAWRGAEVMSMELNSERALVVRRNGDTIATVSFAFDSKFEAIRIFIMRNPDKLAGIDRSSSDTSTTSVATSTGGT